MDQPVPMPCAPLTSTIGMIGTNYSGSTIMPSSSVYFKMYLSSSLNMHLAIVFNLVKMYLALAESDPPISLVPNWPRGASRLMLLDPTKFWANFTIVSCKLASPWCYADFSATLPVSWATFISLFWFNFKQVWITFLWPGLNPSILDGILLWFV